MSIASVVSYFKKNRNLPINHVTTNVTHFVIVFIIRPYYILRLLLVFSFLFNVNGGSVKSIYRPDRWYFFSILLWAIIACARTVLHAHGRSDAIYIEDGKVTLYI